MDSEAAWPVSPAGRFYPVVGKRAEKRFVLNGYQAFHK
jgi:hypothetical protein